MADAATMQDADIYVKTDAGRDEIKSRTLGLPMSIRAILLMVDGQRTVSSMRGLIAGSKAPPDVLDSLVAQGLIEPLAAPQAARPVVAVPAPVPAAAAPKPPTPVASARPLPAPIAPTPPAAAPFVSNPPPAPAVPDTSARLYDGPLDLTLPTIYGPEAPTPTPPAPPDAAPVLDRYEHVYAMMNDVVRDFLSPHRRYFFQLKIERCTTAEDLLDLLNDLETALAKSRGEAFARDVIARLRGAAV